MTRRLVKRASGSARQRPLLALLAVLAVAGVGVWVSGAFAAAAPPAPTLTESPNASPTSSTSITFNYGDSQSGVTFSCTLDGTAKSCSGTTSGSVTFSSLTQGSHTFSIQAVAGGKSSSANSYTWTVDTTAPSVVSINRVGANPTNASGVSWTVTFSEAVTGVAASNLQFVVTGATTAGPVGLAGSGASYTVSTTAGGGDGTILAQLKSVGAGSIKDLSGNTLSTANLPFNGQAYTIDRTPPPAPSIGSGPVNGSLTNVNSASFGFGDTEGGATFLCKLDTGSFSACTSPAGYSNLADGSHTFTVEARDAAGNVSTGNPSRTWTVDTTPPPKPTIVGPNNKSDSTAATFTITDSEANVTYKCQMDGSGYQPCPGPPGNPTYTLLTAGTHIFDAEPIDQAGNIGPYNEWKWTITAATAGGPFSISGDASGLLYPGGPSVTLNLSLTNPNSYTLYVTSLTALLSSVTPQPSKSCSTANFSGVTPFSGGYPIVLPANTTKTLTQLGYTTAQLPSIRMLDSGPQNGCQGAVLHFSYGGNGQS